MEENSSPFAGIIIASKAPSSGINPFLSLIPDQIIAIVSSFLLESGSTLKNVEVAYKTWGKLNSSRDNVLVLCHALTGSSDVQDWWEPLIGPGLAFDPSRWFIFCANVLGSPYGTSSPLSLNPDTGTRYGPEFPQTTTRDDVRLQKLILDYLGVVSIAQVIGGSMGGMAVLEWPLTCPEGYVRHVIPIATSGRHSAWGISWGEAQRQSIYSDPKYLDGYYPLDDPPSTGLAAARMAALLTYRSHNSFEARFGRREQPAKSGAVQNGWSSMPRTPAERALAAHNDGLKNRSPAPSRSQSIVSLADKVEQKTEASSSARIAANGTEHLPSDPLPSSAHAQPIIFSAQSYLRYQGDKFVNRFDANCYISITRKMDHHDLSRGPDRPDWPDVLKLLPPRLLAMAISSDALFTIPEMQEIVEHNTDGRLVIVDSPEGHDGFLLEFEQINKHILDHLHQLFPEIYQGPPTVDLQEVAVATFKPSKTSMVGEAEADITQW